MTFLPGMTPVENTGAAQRARERALLERRAAARIEAERRILEAGVRRFQPITREQQRFLECDSMGRVVLGGNRSGKTYLGAVETVYRLLGEHPHLKVHRAPVKVWACSQDLPRAVRAKGQGDVEVHRQLETLKQMIPVDAMRGGSWATAYSPTEQTVRLANGSVCQFKGYSQGPLQFESQALHFCWFDEEPEDKTIFTSALMRLADHGGSWILTATPVLSLLGKGWIEELWDQREERKDEYEVFQFFTEDNSTLNQEAVDRILAGYTEEERLVRSRGMFARIGGRILAEYDPRKHDAPDFIPPASWRHILIIDPGWTRCAGLFAAIDPDGYVWLYYEHYVEKRRPDFHVAVLNEYIKALGLEDIELHIDPANFADKNTTTGHTSPSDVKEMREAFDALEEKGLTPFKWFRPSKAINADPLAYRVKRYLQADRVRVCKRLKHWRWEQERWTMVQDRDTPAAREREVPERPKKRDDHLMACTRYLFNLLPDALPEPAPRRERTPETFVREHLEKRIERLQKTRKF